MNFKHGGLPFVSKCNVTSIGFSRAVNCHCRTTIWDYECQCFINFQMTFLYWVPGQVSCLFITCVPILFWKPWMLFKNLAPGSLIETSFQHFVLPKQIVKSLKQKWWVGRALSKTVYSDLWFILFSPQPMSFSLTSKEWMNEFHNVW